MFTHFKRKVMLSTVWRTVLVFYMLTSFTVLQIIDAEEDILERDWVEIVNYGMAVIILLGHLVFVIWVDYFLRMNKPKLNLESFKALYGTLYSGVDPVGKD